MAKPKNTLPAAQSHLSGSLSWQSHCTILWGGKVNFL